MVSSVKVCAVIVTWWPDITRLRAVLSSLLPQVSGLVIIDNTPEDQLPVDLLAACSDVLLHVESSGCNLGLAGGQNKGVKWAAQQSFSHVLFLDQDSVPASDMLASLVSIESSLLAKGKKIGVLGPVCVDARTQSVLPFCKIRALQVIKMYHPKDCGGECWCEPEFVISSGGLVRLSVLADVGLMDEKLAIDSVDVEWCYRAAYKGYHSIGVFAALLDHQLGDKVVLLFGGRLKLFSHCPQRLYSMMRNRVYLYALKHVPLRWKLVDLPRLVAKFILFSFFVRPRFENSIYMLKGIMIGAGFFVAAIATRLLKWVVRRGC